MKAWDKLPDNLKIKEVEPYYVLLKRKWLYRFIKRLFDISASFLLIILLSFPSLIIGIIISCNSKGGPFFLQERVGRYGKLFKIIKFRTMRQNTEGNQQITCNNDSRITSVGYFLRKTHLDEFPQLLNVIIGQMSFVGTRPEVKRFVDQYQNEWYASLLMRPGITSTASYTYDNEAKELTEGNVNEIYIESVLPKKMECNLNDIKKSDFFFEISIMLKTVF